MTTIKHRIRDARLTLVGSGPGDPELITLKGLRVLQKADVVLYDALSNEDLLKYAFKAQVKKYVGKRYGKVNMNQQKINELIVLMAYRYGHVVRLKGGDPFVFARGYEELEYAKKFGLQCNVVPGISSAISANSNSQFPITLRDRGRSFHVFTATDSNGDLNPEIEQSIHLGGLKIILMGFHKLTEIIRLYQKYNLGETAIAAIQNGSCKNEKVVFADINTISEKINQAGLKTPVCLYIGELTRLAQTQKINVDEPSLSGIS